MQRQIQDLIRHLGKKRVGLLVNPTSVDKQYNHLIDLLLEGGVNVVALFGPEHGVRGNEQAGALTTDTVDDATGIPAYALYGPRKAPQNEQLDLFDILVYDIQDAGARFYTYCWTMTYAMEACAAADKEFVVFDRPNPVGGVRTEGAPLKFDCGIIGRYWEGTPMSVATRHGLTMGEFATLVNEEFLAPQVRLTVIKMPEYRRSMKFEETGYPWVIPSPNLPTVECAEIYLGTCIFEGSNVSEGRGTVKPFEFCGAPWVNGEQLARHMNGKALPGVRFRPVAFRPTFSKCKDEMCYGVQVHMTDEQQFVGVNIGLHLLKGYAELYPDKLELRDWCDRLMGVDKLYTRIRTESVDSIIDSWQNDRKEWLAMREKYLLYPE